ncbi:MAG: hypothetical protein RLO17_07985 [Cyclobacteriaceae bacterium]
MKAKTKTSQLEYCKIILKKVSFSRELFKKEFTKSLDRLAESESKALSTWCLENFEAQKLYHMEMVHHKLKSKYHQNQR